jgi:hypothetical protein
VIHSDLYVNVPHFAGKFGVERMIEAMGFNATVLRIERDQRLRDLVGHDCVQQEQGRDA